MKVNQRSSHKRTTSRTRELLVNGSSYKHKSRRTSTLKHGEFVKPLKSSAISNGLFQPERK
jgi:hypothetical protein